MKVLVADDNPVVRAGLRAMLATIDEVDDVAEARDGAEVLALLAAGGARGGGPAGSAPRGIDLVFLDIRMPGMDGLTALERIHGVPVVVLTNAAEPDIVQRALAGGAAGYLVYGEFGEAELLAALRLCSAGGIVLSPRAASAQGAGARDRFGLTAGERALVQALSEGLSNQQIARRQHLSEKTVRNYLSRIYTKMNVRSRGEAIVAWLAD